jgi:hypothetical protein
MQLVINIPKDAYDFIKRTGYHTQSLYEAIKNGVPLPKEYGDLVDRDEINSRFNAIWDELENRSNAPSYKELLDKFSMCLDTAKPVIKNNYEDVEEDLCS